MVNLFTGLSHKMIVNLFVCQHGQVDCLSTCPFPNRSFALKLSHLQLFTTLQTWHFGLANICSDKNSAFSLILAIFQAIYTSSVLEVIFAIPCVTFSLTGHPRLALTGNDILAAGPRSQWLWYPVFSQQMYNSWCGFVIWHTNPMGVFVGETPHLSIYDSADKCCCLFWIIFLAVMWEWQKMCCYFR